MKCPKCGYISFDYNETCPRCKKNIAAERDQMNLPAFKPMPPSMLGGLAGDENDSGVDVELQQSEDTSGVGLDLGLSPEDSQAIEAMEETFKDSQDFEIQLETALEEDIEATPETVALPSSEPETPAAAPKSSHPEVTAAHEDNVEEISLDLDDLPVEDLEIDLKQAQQETDDELFLEPALASEGGGGIEESADLDPLEMEDEKMSFDLADLAQDEPDTISLDKIQEMPDDEITINLEELTSVEEVSAENSSKPARREKEEAEASVDIEDLDLELELADPASKTS
jgi:hypothetical protein